MARGVQQKMDLKQTTLLSVPQFADTLGVTRACIRRWILERKITVVKLGRLVRIPVGEVERLINSGLRQARETRHA
jgi:excisionase family DNA binding protein